MRKKNILFLAITGLVVLLDQLTKAWILATLRLHEGFSLIDGFFNIVHVRNPGAAFGFLAAASPPVPVSFSSCRDGGGDPADPPLPPVRRGSRTGRSVCPWR